MDISREIVRRELDLEEEAGQLGAVRYRQRRPLPWRSPEDVPAQDEEANLPPGQQLLKLAVEPTAALIRERITAAQEGKAGRRASAIKWLEESEPEEVAYLAARVALNASVARSTFQTATRQLGEAIIDHVEMLVFRDKNKAGYKGLVKAQKNRKAGGRNRRRAIRTLLADQNSRLAIGTAEKMHLGAFVLESLIEATGLFEVELTPVNGRDKVYLLKPTESVSDWLDRQHARSELLDPMLMPMLVRPRRWRTPFTGGYLRRLPGKRLIKTPDKTYQERLAKTDMPLVYEAINHIQETPWRINTKVLDVMREVWDSGGSTGGLPERNDAPLPPKPVDIDTNTEARTAWKRLAAGVYEANAQSLSRRLGMQQRLWIAEKFHEEAEIYFPHSMDFRGRVYPIPATGLHPQSDDVGKSLLEFAHGLPVGPTGGYWLAVHLANLFGVDKVSFHDRVTWVYDNVADLIDSALRPLDGRRFWLEADSPWLALAAVFDFVNFLDKGPTHVSHIPVALDGSNSGLQHFSAMLRDPVGAEAVNLIPNATPQDVYRAVAGRAEEMAQADAALGVLNEPDECDKSDEADLVRRHNRRVLAARAWTGKITRGVAKRPTMTFVYSATRFGMQDMNLTKLRELDAEGGEPYLGGYDNYAAANYLSYVLYESIQASVRAASVAMGWLRDLARVASQGGIPLGWSTPDGLPVQQVYRNVYGKRVKVHWQGREIKVTLAVDGSGLDTRAQANGVAPNYVHSLDAAHLRAVARGARRAGIAYLALIHDSFGTHAARTDELAQILRDTFVDQYTPDVLAKLREEVAAQLPANLAAALPEPPERGTLDLEIVRHAPYVFA